MFEGLRFNHWKINQDDDHIITLCLDRTGSNVNAISREVLDELSQIIERLSIEKPSGVIIHSAKASGFSVGADIRQFASFAEQGTTLENIRYGQRVYESLARLSCPTVAAVHGTCMGGGMELMLACRQRIAVDHENTLIALPEVMLGIHPGWGGSARLPRMIGAPDALKLMLTGQSLTAKRALNMGVVDRLTNAGQLLDEAKKLLSQPVAKPFARRVKAWLTNTWIARQILAAVVLKQTSAKVRKTHYPAPFALIDVWKHGGLSMRRRLELEARSVAKLAQTSTAKNLCRLFFLQERLKAAGNEVQHGIEHVHIIGAGVMGGDIAAWIALKGFGVTLQDRDMTRIQSALQRARQLYTKKLRTAEKIETAMQRLRPDVEGSGVKDADLTVEVIFENREAKEALYAIIAPQLRANDMLATNTSSISLDELRGTLSATQRTHFLGLHFFNPVAQMPLVEVVRHGELEPSVEKRALAFCRAIGKLPIAVQGTPGFLVNRILMPYLLEALHLYHEGVPGAILDRTAKQFGMPMGPIELADTVGLDVCAAVGRELAPFLGLELPSNLDDKLTVNNRGKKDGKGLYTWHEGRPQKPEVDPNYIPPPDVQERMIMALLNEAVACLADHVVDDADLLDAGVIFGTGFAPFRGGPIQYIRSEGVKTIKARLEELARRYGKRFKPKPGWNDPALAQREFSIPD